MKLSTIALLLAGGIVFVQGALTQNAAAQTADDKKWVAQCVTDNKNEGAKEEVVLKYCTCMNDKMDNNETKSITQWEKTHATERQACDKVAGWK